MYVLLLSIIMTVSFISTTDRILLIVDNSTSSKSTVNSFLYSPIPATTRPKATKSKLLTPTKRVTRSNSRTTTGSNARPSSTQFKSYWLNYNPKIVKFSEEFLVIFRKVIKKAIWTLNKIIYSVVICFTIQVSSQILRHEALSSNFLIFIFPVRSQFG